MNELDLTTFLSIIAVAIGILSLVRDVVNFQVQNSTSRSLIKHLMASRHFYLLLAFIAVVWFFQSRINALEYAHKSQRTNANNEGYVFTEHNGVVVIEAEHYTATLPGSGPRAAPVHWERTSRSDFLGGQALQALPVGQMNTGPYPLGPAVIYQIDFQETGNYFVSIRGAAPAGTSHDSVHVGLGSMVVTSQDASGTGVGFLDNIAKWQDVYCARTEQSRCVEYKPVLLSIDQKGTYTLFVWAREDGVVIDKIILSKVTMRGLEDTLDLPERRRTQ